jgi:hypothetical protein
MTTGGRHILLLAVIVGVVVSCENFYDDTDEYVEAIANVGSMRVDTVVNMTAKVTVFVGTPTPCWSFSRITDTRDSGVIRWTVYTKVKKNITCVQMTGSFTQQLSLTVAAPGTYTLKIYKTPDSTLDTTIVFR